MNTLPRLTEKDMDIFKNKKVFIYSWKYDVTNLYKFFQFFNIEVIGYCIADETRQPSIMQRIKNRLKKLPYIKPLHVANALDGRSDVIIQKFGDHKEHFEQIEERTASLKQKDSNLTSGEIINSFSHLLIIRDLKNPLKCFRTKIRFMRQCNKKKDQKDTKSKIALSWIEFQKRHTEKAIVICSPPKTADHSVMNTFDFLKETGDTERLSYANVWHRPNRIDRALAEHYFNPLKVIIGVREPISQNLSMVFHELGANANLAGLFYRELFEYDSPSNRKELISKYETLFGNGIDVQAYWDIYTGFYAGGKNPVKELPYRIGLIQDFMPEFARHILDITAYPFDLEKGYTVIKEGNTEVFVYQLEKLNNLVPELSEWVGVPFNKLVNGNQASDKWIAESYKQAQKEIKITQEYFDKCFDEPYVKHCYSEADIEKFKARWRPHIKKEA